MLVTFVLHGTIVLGLRLFLLIIICTHPTPQPRPQKFRDSIWRLLGVVRGLGHKTAWKFKNIEVLTCLLVIFVSNLFPNSRTHPIILEPLIEYSHRARNNQHSRFFLLSRFFSCLFRLRTRNHRNSIESHTANTFTSWRLSFMQVVVSMAFDECESLLISLKFSLIALLSKN